MLDNFVNTQQSLLPRNCRTTFRALVEEHEKTPASFPIEDSYLPLSTGLKCIWLSKTKPGPMKYDRMAIAALSRRGAPRMRAPLLPVFPLVLALVRRVEFLTFLTYSTAGASQEKRASFAYKCWYDMKENFALNSWSHSLSLCRNAQMRVERWHKQTLVTQHQPGRNGPQCCPKPYSSTLPPPHTDTCHTYTHLLRHQKTQSGSRLLNRCPPYPLISAVSVLVCFHRQGISGCHGFH